MRYYIRIGMLLLQTLWTLHHVSPILCQVSQHLQDAQLTRLVSLLKYIKVNFFKDWKIWSETVLLSFFYNILKKWGLTSPLKAFIWKKNVG